MARHHLFVQRAALAAVAVVLVACGGDDRAGDRTSGTITVSAAASLTESFEIIGADFEDAHPGMRVEFNFGSSGTLSTQILDGAPVDVFASADTSNMGSVEEAGEVVGRVTVFAGNRLVIVTKAGNPLGVSGLDDLDDVGVVALCIEHAPCGSLAGEALSDAGVDIDGGNVTRGQNVKATLAAVSEGDADAAIVYFTDAKAAADRVAMVEIPDHQNVEAEYSIAALKSSDDVAVTRAFVEHVRSEQGRRVLADAGFRTP